jgi:glutamyl-tRNA synthetase/glutamyl-Q tRNA(Asp) synthetase
MLARLRDRVDGAPVTRFAPSPTGRLHLGHLVNAIYVWGVARALGGVVRLRIEDHDRERSRTEYDRGIFEDLEWLGFLPDAAERQSDHVDRYWDALRRLSDADLVYWCDCSRQRITRDAGETASELRYDGRCRNRGLGPGPNRGIRVRMDEGDEAFEDALLGPIWQAPARQCGDLLVRDRVGNWTYQFAVAIDDLVESVTLVIRGQDLLDSTGRQIRLARLLGRDRPPLFLHHPLVRGADGEKLSKSNHDTGICELRDAGVSPAEVIGRAAAAAGLIDRPRPIAARDVAALFAIPAADRSRAEL